MIGKSLFCLAVFVGSLLGLCANAVTTSKNIDIIVTHGAALTTSTFTNYTGHTLGAGTAISLAQGFRYGDVPPGQHVVIRDAITHAVLAHQQWDEISTWIENGGNGSWRHAVWTIDLPSSLGSGASYQIEFVTAPGAYSASSALALSTLCSGGGAHDLKIHLADVRNQDDTARDSGDATFRVCDNIANVGRDAPRHLRAGPVSDEYVVSGLFVYATSGHQDPLLYAQCVIDLFTDPATGNTLKDIRHVCTTHNSWMNVHAGSAGNAGALGPVGFANDPQAISYRPEILDGATTALNWTNLTQTVSSASNPVSASGGCSNTWQGAITLNVPGSVGNNVMFSGQAVRVSTTGTAVGGLNPGQLYWIYNCGTTTTAGAVTNTVQLIPNPSIARPNQNSLSTSQGTGTTTFTDYFWHVHFESWQALDNSTDENWATAGSTTRFTRRVYPQPTVGERRYWEETGLVLPINLSQTPAVQITYQSELYPLYYPFAKGITIGTNGGSDRPDLGWVSGFAGQAFITGTERDQFLARLFTMSNTTHGYSTLLDESTGRIPVLNNGPPTGPGGNGVGGSYPELGAPQNQVAWGNYFNGLAQPLRSVPNGNVKWDCGIWEILCGTDTDHMPAWDSYSYMFYGSRHFLDMEYHQGNRDMLKEVPGPADSYRDNILDGNHYWGLAIACCQTRGSLWILRDKVFPAALGGDSNVERSYFSDQITENGNYYLRWVDWKDGPGNTEITTSIMPPDFAGSWIIPDTFVINYVALTTFGLDTFVHAPLATQWLPPLQRFYEGVCGEQMAGHVSAAYCMDYTMSPAVHNGDGTLSGGNIGANINGTDASDFGNLTPQTSLLAGGKLSQDGGPYYTVSVGDHVKIENGPYFGPAFTVDQLPGNQWFEVMGPVDNSAGTFYVKCPIGHAVDTTCPTPGAAFTGFTRGGVPLVESGELLVYRLNYNPPTGYVGNYARYGGQTLGLLKVLGQNVTNAISIFNARGGPGSFVPQYPIQWLDDTIVVPGLP